MRIVPINSVREGVMLADHIYSENGDILLKKGVLLTATLIERIKANGVYSVYVHDGFINDEIKDIIKPEVRQRAIKAIKETFKQIEDFNAQMLHQTANLNKRIDMRASANYLSKLKEISEYIVDDIAMSHQLMINLVDIKNLNNYMYQHSLNVAILSTVIGIELRFTKHELYNLFIGAVLHDVGKLFLDRSITEFPKNFEHMSEDMHKLYKSHTERGYKYLCDNYYFEGAIKLIALEHHEHQDGTGYPKGMKGKTMHKFAKVVAVCNKYDDLTSDTPQHKAMPASEAMEYIMASGGSEFDYKIVNIFTRKVNPYPVGTLVKLSDKKDYIVIKTTPNFPSRPIVKEVDIKEKKALKRTIHLMEHTDIVIKKIIQ